jgi:hypothetical protein
VPPGQTDHSGERIIPNVYALAGSHSCFAGFEVGAGVVVVVVAVADYVVHALITMSNDDSFFFCRSRYCRVRC